MSTRRKHYVAREETEFCKARVVTGLYHFIEQELKLRGCLCKVTARNQFFLPPKPTFSLHLQKDNARF